MSSIIKSFRVIEAEPIELLNSKDGENSKINEVIIEEAKKEYEKIIENANKEALKIVEEAENQKEDMINLAYERSKEVFTQSKNDGYKEGYEIGYVEGFDKGYSEGKIISDKLIKESLEIKNGYINKTNNLLKDLEEDIIELVISIYEKVINKKTEEDNELIVSLVLKGISNLDLTEKLTIITSKEDYNMLEMSKGEILAKASMISELEIKYDVSLEKGDCILETAKGNIDVSLKHQLDEVKELLTTILNNEWYHGR